MQNWIEHINRKFIDSFRRFGMIFILLPKRISRLLLHFKKGILYFLKPIFQQSLKISSRLFLNWCLELFFFLLDIFGIGELYEIFIDWIKFKTRPLTEREILLGKSIFKDQINYWRVRIDEGAYIGKRQHIFYVSIYTINGWGKMSDPLFLHELTHVWQYEQMGSVYIPRALRAQFTQMGYNYGGLSALQQAKTKQEGLNAFNLEQQADIIADYHRLSVGGCPRWGEATKDDLNLYFHFLP